MDYDGNDISCHNLQLAGEGKTRSSPVLQPYDFPKFDFGEGLQGQLKFDSLVETEVYLGIQSQEDSQWIEEFSRASNGMEFDSTPADSCSISRRDNVWSEATSSESVEMLLKSVGQEETMPEKSSIQESNACYDQGTLEKHVESVSGKDEKPDGHDTNSETVRKGEFPENNPASKVHVEEQLPESEVPSAALISGKGRTPNEGEQSSQDDIVAELKTVTEMSLNAGAGEDSLHVADSVNFHAGVPSTFEASEQVKDVSQNDGGQENHVSPLTGLEQTESLDEKIGKASEDVHIACNSLCSVKELVGLNNQDTVEARLDCVRETIEGDSEMKSSERAETNASLAIPAEAEKHETENLPAGPMVGPVEGFLDGSPVDGVDKLSADLGGLDAGQIMSPKQKSDPCLQLSLRPNGDKLEDIPLSSSESDSITKIPVVFNDSKKIPVESSSYNNETNASESSDMPGFSSAAGSKQPENVEVCHNDFVVHMQEPGELLPIACKSDSTQVIEENPADMRIDFPKMEQDICKIKEGDENLPTFKTVGSLTTDEMTESLDFSKNAIVIDHKLQHQTAGKMELENDVSPQTTSSTKAGAEDDYDNAERKAAVTGLSPPDNDCQEAAITVESGMTASTEVHSDPEEKDGMVDAAARSPSTTTAAEPPQCLDKSNDVNITESPLAEDMNLMSSNHSGVDVGCGKSSLEECVDADLVCGVNQDVTTMKVDEEKDSAEAAEVDKASCGSPTIISSSEPSQMDKEQEGTGGSAITEKSVEGSGSASENAKLKDAMGDDTSFTFKVNILPDTAAGEAGRSWSPVPDADKSKSSLVVAEASNTVKGKAAKTPSKRTPRSRVSDGEPAHGKGSFERKGRRASAKGMAKENAKKGKKDTDANQESASAKVEKGSRLSIACSSTPVQFGMTPPYGLIEQSSAKLSSAVAAPHLSANNSSSSAAYRPPFTDVQQVQLRAQIFVYGSLIQGTAPDEACMTSAFGPSDGGRSMWEPVWRAAIERVRSQKSNSTPPETPLPSQSGARTADSAVKESSHSSKVLPSPVSRAISKGTPAAAVNPIIPLSSPLWSVSTPARDSSPSSVSHKVPMVDYPHTASPMHAYQTPPIKNFVGQTTWAQTCFPGPWLPSPQSSTFNSNICFQPVTMVETVKLTPAKGASGVLTSGVKHATSSASHTVEVSPVHGVKHATSSASLTVEVSPVHGVSALSDSKPNASSEKHSTDSKPRKRKKVSGTDPGEASLVSVAQSEPVVVSNVSTNLSSPAPAPAPAPVLDPPSPVPTLSKAAGDALIVPPIDCLERGSMDAAASVTCSEETLGKVAEAKNQAEDAAALAAAAVSHSENLWSQLAKQKESGLTSEAEVKLASASVAIAAAASVAKAAAAAARVAYSAALQAKQMADEACVSSKCSGNGTSSVDMHDLGNATPVSILKSGSITNESNSILVAAKEAAKRRVEAASAAAKQAENLDAIVKAAELAAAAVSQAGKIVAMGEPLPLSDLMEAGPEGYWKLPHSSPELGEKVADKNKELTSTRNLGQGAAVETNVSKELSVGRGGLGTGGHGKICSGENSIDPQDGHASLVDGTMEPMVGADRGFKSSGDYKGSETTRSSEVVSELDARPRADVTEVDHDELPYSVPEDRIQESCLVEVFKLGDGLKSAWYSASVQRVEDGKAYVCYSDLLSDEGSANLCEWVDLEAEGDKAPIIRLIPFTTLPVQATRKRRRAALGDYAWSVGDRVDVWIDDCWREGVVTEKNEKDETTLKVHFPAQGETLTVRAWNLRTSRLWKDGKWVEWSSSRGNDASEQSDAPQEKRQKLGSATEPTDGKDTPANDVDSDAVKADGSRSLALSASDRTFNIGKGTREDKRNATQRSLRSGQQKEGSRVVFGVPKPTGKKRKFMEVSKHFPANKSNKNNEANESVKFAKYLMPQATASRGWKAPLRSDSKEKRSAELRSRAPTTRKPNRPSSQKDNINATPAQGNGKSTDNEEAVMHDESQSEKSVEPGSSACEEASETPLLSLFSTKRSSSNTRSERVNRGKLAPSGGKLSKIVEEKVHNGNPGNSVTEATEPRRSNRRIQPTHRLLEGLQSSMIIPKMPSVSHERGPRNPSRNVSTKGK